MRHQKTFSRKDGSKVTIVSSVVCNLFSRGIDFDVFAFVEKTDSSEKDYFYPHKGLMAVARPHEILKTNLEALKLAGGVA